jgi:hypothetical protein
MSLIPLDPQALQIKTTEVKSNCFYKITGPEISWEYVQPKSAATFTTTANSHLWSEIFGLYSQTIANKYDLTFDQGGYSNTMIETIKDAYDIHGMYVGSVSKDAFRASLFKNFRLVAPITGSSAGAIYSSFIEQNNSTQLVGTGPCASYAVDSMTSESHLFSTSTNGVGYAYDTTNNPGANDLYYKSGIVWLFSESVDIPYTPISPFGPTDFSGSTTGTTWDTGWSGNSRYTFDGGKLAIFNGPKRDVAVGMANLDSGYVALFHPDIVNNFHTGSLTGGTIATGATFNSSVSNMVVRDCDLTTQLNININLAPGDYPDSNNPSLLDASAAGIECGSNILITEVCLFNNSQELMGIAKLDEPVTKNVDDFQSITAVVSLDGGTKPDICDEVGRETYTLPN